MFELKQISFLSRLCFVLKKKPGVTYLFLILTMLILGVASIVFSFLIFFLFYLVPVLYESYIYLYKVEVKDDCVKLYYLRFNKKSCITVKGLSLRVKQFDASGLGSKTGNFFRIVNDFGQGHVRKVITQYEINDWANKDNVQKLKLLISPV